MKYLILAAFLCVEFQAVAYPCPANMAKSQSSQAIQAWMSRLQGRSTLGNCSIEVTACNPDEAPGEGRVLGEVYVVDARKREAYLPLIIADQGDPKILTSLEWHRKSFFYVKVDYYYEAEFGRQETYQLDLHTDDQGKLQALALGTYSTNKALHSPDGNESRWYDCGQTN